MPHTPKFADLEACYGQLMTWCDLLEAIADFLPCHLDERLCDTMTEGLLPLLQTTHCLEERVICAHLPLIMEGDEHAEAREHRRVERIGDLEGAREVVDVLLSLKSSQCRLSWDAVGYLLRSFFCAMRKHVKAERQIVLMIGKALARQQEAANQPAGSFEAA